MDYLLSSIENHGYFVPLAIVIGIIVMIAAYGLMSVVGSRADPLRRRIRELWAEETTEQAGNSTSLFGALRPLGHYLLPHREKERETLHAQLMRAGFTSEGAAVNLYVVKIVLILLLPAILCTWLLKSMELQAAYVFFFGALASFIGMLLPNYYLRFRIAGRQRQMMNSLPDALDLLVSCTEAGLGLNGALQRVARQMDISSPLLARELEQVNAEIRGGVDRIVALKNFGERTGLEEIRGLVSLLSQSMRFGSPIAEILRIYADEFRDKRTQRAEEQAALVGTKLIFPLCFCIFPAFFVVSVGPAVIGVMRAMSGANFGS